MVENERTLAIYEFLSPSYLKGEDKFSRILLQGKWLRDLGFKVGKKVSVKTIIENGETKLLVSLAN